VRSDFSAEPTAYGFLAETTGDWRRELVEQLLRDLGEHGSIVVYSSYERTQLSALAKLFPGLGDRIDAVIARLFDLEAVFKHGYCHPDFAGRTTIKKVLPAMVPDLDYAGLAIANGADAAGAFALMRVGEYAVETHEKHRTALIEYCALDTMALVRLHHAVAAIAGIGT
jgi:hypothetical protein